SVTRCTTVFFCPPAPSRPLSGGRQARGGGHVTAEPEGGRREFLHRPAHCSLSSHDRLTLERQTDLLVGNDVRLTGQAGPARQRLEQVDQRVRDAKLQRVLSRLHVISDIY